MGITAHNLRRRERELARQPRPPAAPQTFEEVQRARIAQLGELMHEDAARIAQLEEQAAQREEQAALLTKANEEASALVEQLRFKYAELTTERDSLVTQLAEANAQLEEMTAPQPASPPEPSKSEHQAPKRHKRRG